jgi:hypothetical protein
MGVCYSYKRDLEIKQTIDRRQKNQQEFNLKVLNLFWNITEQELHNIQFTDKSINETPFVTPFYNLFFKTRKHHLEYTNIRTSILVIIESNQRKMNQHRKYAKYNDYKHIVNQIIKFQKMIDNLQDLKVLLGPVNYKILYNTLTDKIRNS